jgi:hypothetical protein
MPEAGKTPPNSVLDLGVLQAMVDIGEATAADAGRASASRQRDEDGFLSGSPEHYTCLAEAIIDLIQAHPVLGPQELAEMLPLIERAAWRRQDRLYRLSGARRERFEAWRRRRRTNPNELEKLIDQLRDGA